MYLITDLNNWELIDNNISSPESNSEKITQEVSILVNYTKDCCFNCCSGEKSEGPDYYRFVTCNNPSSWYTWLDNSATGILCNKFENIE